MRKRDWDEFTDRRGKKEPHVGIFWLVRGRLFIDSTPLSKAEPYGDHLIHPRSHLVAWTLFQESGIAPVGMEHEEAPRGRVTYDTKARRFMLLADKCILRDLNVVRKIMAAMSLPAELLWMRMATIGALFACARGCNTQYITVKHDSVTVFGKSIHKIRSSPSSLPSTQTPFPHRPLWHSLDANAYLP